MRPRPAEKPGWVSCSVIWKSGLPQHGPAPTGQGTGRAGEEGGAGEEGTGHGRGGTGRAEDGRRGQGSAEQGPAKGKGSRRIEVRREVGRRWAMSDGGCPVLEASAGSSLSKAALCSDPRRDMLSREPRHWRSSTGAAGHIRVRATRNPYRKGGARTNPNGTSVGDRSGG